MESPAPDPVRSATLAAFVTAVDAGSIRAAAERLDLTQSAVTKRVQALERRLGVELLERRRTGVRPTEAGRELYPVAREAVRALAEVERAARSRRPRHPPALRLAASHTVGEFLLPGWLAEFARDGARPPVQVDIRNSSGVVEAVLEGDAQIGFVEHDDPTDGLASLVMCRDELAVVVAADRPWPGRRWVHADELTTQPFLTREERSGTRGVAQRRLAAHGIVLRPALETASTQSLKRAVLSGGFTLISRLTVEAEQTLGTLRTLGVRDVDLRRDLRAIRLAGTPAEPARSFWSWLQAQSARREAPGAPLAGPARRGGDRAGTNRALPPVPRSS